MYIGNAKILFLKKKTKNQKKKLSSKSTEEFSKPLFSILKLSKQALKTWLVLAVEQSVCSLAIDGVGYMDV